MKKTTLLVFSAVLVVAATGCHKENASESSFAGIDVEVGENNGRSRLYILNEGSFPGASTLDLLDFKNKKYCADIFGQANPEIVQGIGNLGNDMAIVNGRLWVLMNVSNQVAVLSLPDARLERFLDIEAPRHIVTDGNYAYISSYGAAVYGGDPVPGKVYRVDRTSYQTSSVEVGYQPEGLGVLNGKLYVANSGGYNYVHDNRVTVIDLNSFRVERHLTAPVTNLNQVEVAGDKIWISSYGESTWYQDDKGEWKATVSEPMSLTSLTPDGEFTVWEGVHADKMTATEDVIVCFGNSQEMEGGYDYCLYKVNAKSDTFMQMRFANYDLSRIGYAYGLLVDGVNGDLYVCDASFTAGSKLHCFDINLKHKWTVNTGVGTGHLLLQ